MIRLSGNKAAVRTVGFIMLCLLVCLPVLPRATHAALLELRPGPIELPHFVAAADLDRDGYQDLIVANFQAGTLDLLINQKDGTFAPSETSPEDVGSATFSNPTSGPLIILVADLNPDDVDSDTIANSLDNCPNVPNSDQTDVTTAEGLDGFCGARGPDNICNGVPDDDPSLFGPDTTCGTADDLPGADDLPALNGPDGICGTTDDTTGSSGVGNACRTLETTDLCGIPDSPLDSDCDGRFDFDPAANTLDNCPLTPNPLQEDIDGDNIGDVCQVSPDLVILENSVGFTSPLGIVRVKVNDGSGGLDSRVSKLTGLQPASIVLDDFDGDLLQDAVVSSGDSDALQLFPGGPNGNFLDQVVLDTRDNPQGLASGDFDGDGDPDLAVAQACDHSIGFFRNDNGTLPPTQTAFVSTDSPILTVQPNLLVPGLFNDDPLVDLAVLGFEDSTCTAGWVERLDHCCVKNADCEDPADPDDDDTGICAANGSGLGIVQVFLGRFLCSGGPNDGMSCANDIDCADSPPDPATDGTCVTLAPNPTATINLGAGERATAGILEDFDGDGTCNGMEAGNCDIGVTDTCLNPSASGEPCASNADCTRALCDAGSYIGRVCQEHRDCSTGDLAISIGRAAGGSGHVTIYPGLGDGSFSPVPTDIGGFVLPQSLTPINLDPMTGDQLDLAVLDRDVQRTILFDNDDIAGTVSFTVTPESPASAWKLSSAMELAAIDLSVGIDLVLLQETPPRLDSLSGIGNGFFRSLPSLTIEGEIDDLPALTEGSDLLLAVLRDNSRADLVVLDTSNPSTGYMTVVLNTVFGVLQETETHVVPGGFISATSGSLITDISDYDFDGVANLLDNCPTRYNPAGCKVDDPTCKTEILCDDPLLSPTDCASADPTTGQCDSDGNGIGDHCQLLSAQCAGIDSDFDFLVDYDPNALDETSSGAADFDRDDEPNVSDNCPTVFNSDQLDDDRAEGPDGTCLTVDDNVFLYGPDNICGTADDEIGNLIGDACQIPLTLTVGQCNLFTGRCVDPVWVSCTNAADCDRCTGASDADNDGVCDYDPRVLPQPDEDAAVAAALDDCIGIANPRRCSNDLTILCDQDVDCGAGATCAQPDNAGDRVGNACIIEAALDNCPFRANTAQADTDRDGVGNDCAVPVTDVVTVDKDTPGTITPFTGDGSGRLFAGTIPPLTGFTTPSSALVGNFSLNCISLFKDVCFTSGNSDIVVAEQVVVGNPNDDLLTLLRGDGTGNFATGACDSSGQCDTGTGTCQAPASAAGDSCTIDSQCDRCDASNPASAGLSCTADVDCRLPIPAPTQGDPDMLRAAQDQPLCSSPQDPSQPFLRFDNDAISNLIVVPQPAIVAPATTATIGIFLPSNQALLKICSGGPFPGDPCVEDFDCEGGTCVFGNKPSLVPPPGHPDPLPVPAPLTAVVLDDMNRDGIIDIVALSSGDTDPLTPNLTLYMGIGNGLYYTDPTLNPTDVLDGATLVTTDNVNLVSDLFLPEVALFYPPDVLAGDRGPIVLTNILNERADLDGSGRIDGFDMAVLSRSFGAVRGEDFSLVVAPNGQLQLAQTGVGKCAVNSTVTCTADIDCPGGKCTDLFRRVLDNTNGSTVGTDLPDDASICNLFQDRMTAGQCDTSTSTCTSPGSRVGDPCNTGSDCGDVLYGLAIDINLDGMIDGLDLAIMASVFGRSL